MRYLVIPCFVLLSTCTRAFSCVINVPPGQGIHVDCSKGKYLKVPKNLPQSMTSLDLLGNELTRLRNGELEFPNLTSLDLKFNKLETLEPGSLSYLTHLHTLDLRFNLLLSVTSLPVTDFIGLTSLYVLKLGPQGRESEDVLCADIDRNIFSHLSNVELLHIGWQCEDKSRNVATLHIGVRFMKNLKTLTIGPGTFGLLANSSLEPLEGLNVSDLQLKGQFGNISPFIFRYTTSVSKLKLPRAPVKSINAAFHDVSSMELKSLVIKIPRFTSEFFCNVVGETLEELIAIDLTDIFNVEPDLFFGCLKKLRRFSLPYFPGSHLLGNLNVKPLQSIFRNIVGKVEILHFGEFNSYSHVYYSQYIDCSLKNLEPCDTEIKDYQRLGLPWNILDTLDQCQTPSDGVVDFQALPRIVSIHGATAPCVKLTKRLIASYNNARVPLLQLLNNITSRVEVISLRHSSLFCNIGKSEIETPELSGFGSLNNVRYLDISHIGLKSLPPMLEATRITKLLASHNRLGRSNDWKLSQEDFWGGACLQTLDLSFNLIRVLPVDILTSHKKLEDLNVAGNRLTDLDFTLPAVNTLKSLNISHTGISTLSDNFLAWLDTHQVSNFSLDLTGNRFPCVCSIINFARWLKSTNVNVASKDKITCLDGSQEMIIVDSIDYLCRKDGNILVTSLSSVAATIIVTVVIFIIVWNKRFNILVWYHFQKLRWSRICKKDLNEESKFQIYIVYNEHCLSDRRYVIDTLMPLVEGTMGQKLFIWDRDANVGVNMGEEIVTNMSSCSSIIIILSTDMFLKDQLKRKDSRWWKTGPRGRKGTISLKHSGYYAHSESHASVSSSVERESKNFDSPLQVQSNSQRLSTLSGTISENYQTDASNKEPTIDLQNGDQNVYTTRGYNEWMDFTLLTVMRLIKDKKICVLMRDDVTPASVAVKWHSLLFPNIFMSPLTVIREKSHRFVGKLTGFINS